MDRSKVVWICPAGTGPTDRLLTSLLVRDMLRAGLSRRDTPERDRKPYRLYLDELISLDGAASSSLAEITEQLRKFAVRMHGMTQLLHRLSSDVRTSLLQNAPGGPDGRAPRPPADAAELDRYHHWASFTVAGKRIGPLQIRGPQLNEVFGDLARPGKVRALLRAAHSNTGAKPLTELTAVASTHEATVRAFLTRPMPGPGAGPGEQGPGDPDPAGPNLPSDDTTPQEQYA